MSEFKESSTIGSRSFPLGIDIPHSVMTIVCDPHVFAAPVSSHRPPQPQLPGHLLGAAYLSLRAAAEVFLNDLTTPTRQIDADA